MKVSLIVAIAENNVIGKDNDLIWHLPDDLKHFKSKTSGHTIIMGRKTFESIGSKPLPKRENIVISRNPQPPVEGVIFTTSLEEALKHSSDQEPFIVGGAEIYRQSMGIVDVMEITRVHESFEGDTFFPEIDPEKWTLENEETHAKDENHKHAFSFQTWVKKL